MLRKSGLMFLMELINVQMIVTSIRFRAGEYAYQYQAWKNMN